MRPSSLRVLLLGLALFLLGGFLIFLALERGSDRLLWAGVGVLVMSVGSFSVGTWLSRRQRDPLDQRRERRLWKSGPLGRKWLEGRRRLP